MSCKGLTFEECELVILRIAMDKAEKRGKERKINLPETAKIINIVVEFIKNKKLICYGGTAINNIIPSRDQFYDKHLDLPDYDFFSTTPMEDAKELCDIYHKQGFTDIEAKSGQHPGTYKVFVNFMPIADITFMEKKIFENIKEECIHISNILYAPPNFLRMSMFIELSRPEGDVSRWEKVLKRLILLNKHYPIARRSCKHVNFQRKMFSSKIDSTKIYEILLENFSKNNVVFFGGFAVSLFSKYMKIKISDKQPDFDVISTEPEKMAKIIKKKLEEAGFEKVTITKHSQIGELVGKHFQIKIGVDTVSFIYEPLSCHSYNKVEHNGTWLNIATIDTMLSFYLAFLYLDKPYYDTELIVCMSQYLFEAQQHNRLKQKGLLKRFSIDCIGKQPTLEEIKEEKTNIYNRLKKKRDDPEFQKYFFRYKPHEKFATNTLSKTVVKPKTISQKSLKTLKSLGKPLKTSKNMAMKAPKNMEKKTKRKPSRNTFMKWLKY